MADREFNDFLDASARLTGYDRAELLGTGCAEEYWAVVQNAAPRRALERMFSGKDSTLDAAVIELWYLGTWMGAMGTESDVVSPRAYRESLVWNAIGSHPMGAKQPGYGSWALPPKVEKSS